MCGMFGGIIVGIPGAVMVGIPGGRKESRPVGFMPGIFLSTLTCSGGLCICMAPVVPIGNPMGNRVFPVRAENFFMAPLRLNNDLGIEKGLVETPLLGPFARS